MTLAEKLSAPFDPSEVRQFQGRGGQTFDYIEDETVMDRLDEVLGVGNWSIHVEPISVADGIVKVTLAVATADIVTSFEDFGYANNPNGDGLKEAVTDGIRRCGRYLGVGRYLYKKHAPINGTGRGAPSSTPRLAAVPPPQRTSTDIDPYADLPPEWDAGAVKPANGGSVAPAGAGWTFKQLAEAAEAKGIAKNVIYQTADTLFGKETKVTALTGAQREQIAFEMGL